MGRNVALQLYTVRRELALDLEATLQRVAEIGYEAVEFAGCGGRTSNEITALLTETGLRCAAAHLPPEKLDSFADELEFAKAIGSSYLVLAGLPRDNRDPERLAPFMTQLGDACSQQGLKFAYHNHDWEFKGSEFFADRLLELTDPELVSLELDTYWAAFAGASPLEYLRVNSGRIPLVHLKDMSAEGGGADVGDGVLGLDGIYESGSDLGVDWFIVEHDDPHPGGFASAERSLRNLLADR